MEKLVDYQLDHEVDKGKLANLEISRFERQPMPVAEQGGGLLWAACVFIDVYWILEVAWQYVNK